MEIKSPSGLIIPFGSSDVKALLSYFLGEIDNEDDSTWYIGDRCDIDIEADPSKENTTACADANAGAFHLALFNLIGRGKHGFVIDRVRSDQVWNQPVFAYNATVISQSPTSAHVELTIYYADETDPSYQPILTNVVNETYAYLLELDSNSGNITGGEFLSWDRPDFAWMSVPHAFWGYWQSLGAIYAASTKQADTFSGPVLDRTAHPAHIVLTDASGALAHVHPARAALTSTTAPTRAPRRSRVSWSIVPDVADGRVDFIDIKFTAFETQRFHDQVKVFEGARGEGALLAVLHGSSAAGVTIRVASSAAYVEFVSDVPLGHVDAHSAFAMSFDAHVVV